MRPKNYVYTAYVFSEFSLRCSTKGAIVISRFNLNCSTIEAINCFFRRAPFK